MSEPNECNFELVAPYDGGSHYMSERTIINPNTRRELGVVAQFNGYELLPPTESPYGERLRFELGTRVIDQPAAIEAIVDAVDRLEVRTDYDRRPVAVLAFLGPTGVGKTETALALSHALSGSEDDLLKIDRSQSSHGHEVATLIGSPPGYVSRDQEAMLNKDEVESTGKVILFDEIEKGSPELFNLMLQITDKGSLTLNNGETVSFRDAVIIMTSNLGASEMAEQLSSTRLGFGTKTPQENFDVIDATASKAFDKFFAPEFIGRITKKVVFHPLTREGLSKVIDLKLEQANTVYQQSYKIKLDLSEACRNHLIDRAMEKKHLGARPLIDLLDQQIYSEFGRHTSAETVTEYYDVMVFHEDELPADYRELARNSLVFASRPSASRRPNVPVSMADMERYYQSIPSFMLSGN